MSIIELWDDIKTFESNWTGHIWISKYRIQIKRIEKIRKILSNISH